MPGLVWLEKLDRKLDLDVLAANCAAPRRCLCEVGCTGFFVLCLDTARAHRHQDDVLTAQAGEFRRPQSGLHGQQQQGSITPSAPGAEVRRSEQGLDFHRREEADWSTYVPLTLHGEHTPRQRVVLRRMQRDKAKERVEGGETHVAAAGTVVAILLKMIEKGAEEWSIHIGHGQL